MKKHLNETKFASKISTSASILCTDIPASKIPSPENTMLEHPRRKETSKRRVDRAEPIRQTANLPPHHISSRTSTKIQFVENSRLLEEEGERYIYIYRQRIQISSYFDNGGFGPRIGHNPTTPSSRASPPSAIILRYTVGVYIYMLDIEALRDVMESRRRSTPDPCEKLLRSMLGQLSDYGIFRSAAVIHTRRNYDREGACWEKPSRR